jgi:uncharacterized membrane protein
MSPTGTFHLIFNLGAVLLGAVVMWLPKGTRWHRAWGHGYFWCMAGVVGTSFAMFSLTGRVTPFHFAAVVAGLTLLGGMWTALRRRPKKYWINAHATWMAWSYVGLLAALVAESLTRFVMPALEETLAQSELWPAFWTVVAIGSFGTMGLGAWQIRKRLPAAIRSTPQAMRRDREQDSR